MTVLNYDKKGLNIKLIETKLFFKKRCQSGFINEYADSMMNV